MFRKDVNRRGIQPAFGLTPDYTAFYSPPRLGPANADLVSFARFFAKIIASARSAAGCAQADSDFPPRGEDRLPT